MTPTEDAMPADRDEQAALWCLMLAEGELPRHRREAFDCWIADRDNARAFEDAALVWNGVEGAASTPELLHMRSAALKSLTSANRRRWTRRLSPRYYWIGAIAALFLVAILSVTLFFQPGRTYRTGIGERSIAMLDDGSRLSLDADTEVAVRFGKDRRELTLIRGRAKFDVAHDPLRPFAVTVGDKIVVATGTAFSVEVLDRKIHVLLYEGRVAVLDRTDDQPVRQRAAGPGRPIAADQALTPGRELIAGIGAADSATVQPVDGQQSLSWESGQISFDDEPLPNAIARMNRYSKDQLAIADDRLADVRVSGVFTAGDSEAFVEGVAALNPLQVAREPGRISLKRP